MEGVILAFPKLPVPSTLLKEALDDTFLLSFAVPWGAEGATLQDIDKRTFHVSWEEHGDDVTVRVRFEYKPRFLLKLLKSALEQLRQDNEVLQSDLRLQIATLQDKLVKLQAELFWLRTQDSSPYDWEGDSRQPPHPN